MDNTLKFKDYIPVKSIPVEYSTYQHEEYVAREGIGILGMSAQTMLNYIDTHDISQDMYEQFHEIYPNSDDYIYLSKHSLREFYYETTHQKSSEIVLPAATNF